MNVTSEYQLWQSATQSELLQGQADTPEWCFDRGNSFNLVGMRGLQQGESPSGKSQLHMMLKAKVADESKSYQT